MKRFIKIVLLVVTLSQVSFASHCTSAVAFLIYAMQLRNAGVISMGDVATLTTLKTVTYEEVNKEISNGGLARLGAGDFHVGYDVNTTRVESPLSEVKGQVAVVANGNFLP